jgi:hypothetical protein
MNRHRILLAIRAIDVSYRSAIRHAPPAGPKRQEWLGHARQRAEQLLDGPESQLPHDEVDAEVSAQLRVVGTTSAAPMSARGAAPVRATIHTATLQTEAWI